MDQKKAIKSPTSAASQRRRAVIIPATFRAHRPHLISESSSNDRLWLCDWYRAGASRPTREPPTAAAAAASAASAASRSRLLQRERKPDAVEHSGALANAHNKLHGYKSEVHNTRLLVVQLGPCIIPDCPTANRYNVD